MKLRVSYGNRMGGKAGADPRATAEGMSAAVGGDGRCNGKIRSHLGGNAFTCKKEICE